VPHVRPSVRGPKTMGEAQTAALTDTLRTSSWVPHISLVFRNMWDTTDRSTLAQLGLWRRGNAQQGLRYADSGAKRTAQRTGYFANPAGTFAATDRDLADA
jgi:hypothetical protein